MRTANLPGSVAATLLLSFLVLNTACAAEEGGEAGPAWLAWRANTDIENTASLQRGARNFASYCLGCHSLKYERWTRLGADLGIPPSLLQKDVLPPGDKLTDYVLTSMPAAQAETWFGKTPPDLSLMARARGKDYLYQFLKTFYADPARPTGVNNLRFPLTAMPNVLSELEGVKGIAYKNVEAKDAEGKVSTEKEFDHFVQLAPGRMSEAEYDGFVRDTVNFLDYVGEPAQLERRAYGIWVVLFLLVFTGIAWLMKREYWKDVH